MRDIVSCHACYICHSVISCFCLEKSWEGLWSHDPVFSLTVMAGLLKPLCGESFWVDSVNHHHTFNRKRKSFILFLKLFGGTSFWCDLEQIRNAKFYLFTVAFKKSGIYYLCFLVFLWCICKSVLSCSEFGHQKSVVSIKFIWFYKSFLCIKW